MTSHPPKPFGKATTRALVHRTEVYIARNLPAMLCFHNPAVILTVHSSVTMHQYGKAAEHDRKVFCWETAFGTITRFQSCKLQA